ncbi:failed axon connections homolog [Exaiptasia diaphana]|uniref:Failed axon connections protein n=1 Tax=Exaiptasia diaphana TaxID=2652724 RepID=A0A913YKH2_EXADI|nr:failed axon connections homolog [Exaiptasia diaphana]
MELAIYIVLLGISVVFLIGLLLHISRRKKTKSVPNGVVLLHIFKRIYNIVNMSPPCLKLETYLRMAKIPYECDFSFKMSSKGKMPWLEYNGKEIADSNFCIEFLNKEFGVDVDDHLSDEQKGIARSVLVMLEENTYWTMVHYRWLGDFAIEFRETAYAILPKPIRCLIFAYFQNKTKQYMHGHGIGRHSPEEIYGIAEKDLKAVSAILGEKKFLFGDKPCLADAAVFALVYNFLHPKPNCPQGKLILTQLKNLEDHSNRMKETFYPDWDELVNEKTKIE